MNKNSVRQGYSGALRSPGYLMLAAVLVAVSFMTPLPHAQAQPDPGDADPSVVSACGSSSDTSPPLWVDVNPASVNPQKPGTNKEVVWPGGNSNAGFAIHDGAAGGAEYNWLLVPTRRIKGIECSKVWGPDDPRYFNDAYSKVGYIGRGNPGDWAFGIESALSRTYDQMHIHMARLQNQARADIDAAVAQRLVATNEADWINKTITVMGNTFRAWNADSMDHQFFYDLNQHVVSKLQGGWMGNETLLIVANHKGSGFIVLNSDRQLKNGVDNIEKFLYKG